MNGATQNEMVEFKRIKNAQRVAVTHDDAKAVKRMVADWIRRAQSVRAKFRRRRMANCIRFANSEFPD